MIQCRNFQRFVEKYYLPYAKQHKKSYRTELSIIKCHILSTYGKSRLDRINVEDVDAWLLELKQNNYLPSTCNRYLCVLRAIFKLAMKYGIIASKNSPCQRYQFYKVDEPQTRAISKNKAKELMEYLTSLQSLPAFAISMLITTGARKSEILRGSWADVDFENKIYIAPVSKSGRKRYIPLSSLALKILAKIPRTSPYIFPNKSGDKPLTDIFGFWKKTREMLDLKNVRIHDLRHTFASILVQAGATLYQVQNLLGHKSPVTTMRYAHINNNELLNCAEMVGKTLWIKKRRSCIGKIKKKHNFNFNENWHSKTNNYKRH